MSDQSPLTPPSPKNPAFEPYDAPAYGSIGPDAPTQARPLDLTKPDLTKPGDALTPPAPAPEPSPQAGLAPYSPAGGAPGQGPWPTPYPGAQGGPVPYQVNPAYVGAIGAPSHPLATTSLVLGVIGIAGVLLTPIFYITFLSALCSPFAIWLGVRSKREIKAQPMRYGGEGLATAGFVTGIVGLVLGILALLLIIALVGLIALIFTSAG